MAEDELLCSFCHRKIKEPRLLPCLHSFCNTCIDNISSYKPKVKENVGNKLGLQSLSKTVQGWSNSDSLKQKTKHISGSFQNISPIEIWSTPCTPLSSRRNIPQDSERQIVCPLCKTIVNVPSEGASLLPLNHLLQNKIILSSFHNADKNINCDLCSEGSPAVYHCTTCNDNLCQFCHEAHSRQRKTSTHKTILIVDIPDSELLHVQQIKCSLHQDIVFTHFCDSCQVPICQMCINSVHKNHNYEVMPKAIKLQRLKVSQAVNNVQVYLNLIDTTLQDCKKLEGTINQKTDSVCLEIDKFYEAMIKAIQEHQSNLKAKAMNLKDDKLKVLSIQMVQLNHIKKDIDSGISFAEELLDCQSDSVLIDLSVPVIKRLNSLEKVQRKLQLRADDNITFNLDEVGASFFDQKIIGRIEGNADSKIINTLTLQKIDKFEYHHGSITIAKILAKHDFLELPNINRILDCKLTATYTERCHPVRLEISGNYKQELLVLSSFLPFGKYKLEVRYGSAHIQSSPQELNFDGVVNSTCEHSGEFHYCNFDSKDGLNVWGNELQGQCKGSETSKKHWSCCGSTEERSSCTSLYHVTV